MAKHRQLCIIIVAIIGVYAQETNISGNDTTLLPKTMILTDSLVLDNNISSTIASIEASKSSSSNMAALSNEIEGTTTTGNKEISTSSTEMKTTETASTQHDILRNITASSIVTSIANNEIVSPLNNTIPTVSTSLASPLPQHTSTASPNHQFIENDNTTPFEMEDDHNKTEEQEHYNNLALSDKPETCEGREMLPQQPTSTGESALRKCCPVGESIYYGENGKKEYCDTTDKPFEPDIVDVTLYDDCIEDNEREVDLEIEAGNPCNVSFVYSRANGDILFVLQNGSLLLMDEYGNQSYAIKDDYCLDVDYKTGELFAVVCVAPVTSHLERGQTILFAIFMIASIPCLILVSFFHFAIRRLRTMHGLCLGLMSSCLAMGFLLHSVAQLSENSKSKVGYAVQYFMLSYFMWLLVLCCNVVIIVWYYLPRYIRLSRTARYLHFATYSAFALTIPLCIVLITRSKGLGGMPSYFYQAWSESIQSSQRYFIPPVTTILILCFIFLIIAYFGFRKLDKMVETRSIIRYTALNRNGKDDTGLPVIDLAMLEETKQDAKCITYLAIIVLTTWIMEVITFYSPGSGDYLACMEIINGLQGVFILIFFIGVRHRRHIIVRWWHDRGSIGITEIEMENLKQDDRDK